MSRRELFAEILRVLEDAVGRSYLNHLLGKVLYDLSYTFEGIRKLKLPEDPYELEIDSLSHEEFEELLSALAEVLGFIKGTEIREEFLSKLRELNEE